MILSAEIKEKSFGSKVLYDAVDFEIQDGEKVGLIALKLAGTTLHIGEKIYAK